MKLFSLLLCSGVVFFSPLGQAWAYDEPEAAWQHVLELKKKLSTDAPPGTNEVEFSAPIQAELRRNAIDFVNTFPNDPRRTEAMLLALKTVTFPASVAERQAVFDRQETLLQEIRKDQYITPLINKDAERTVLRQHLDHLDLVTTKEEATDLEQRLASYLERFPADPKAGALQVRRVDLLEKVDPKRAAWLLETLATSDDPAVAAAAKGRQKRQAVLAAPLDWKFTAADGTPVDLAQWRGRYVLVEFWASWCPDCLREMPDVLAAYNKYHTRGLEVVGVSLDRDAAALEGFVKKRRIPWPQLYDGKGWDAEIPVKYGVKGIPEMWLVDKEGRVVASGLHGSQLDEKLASLFGS